MKSLIKKLMSVALVVSFLVVPCYGEEDTGNEKQTVSAGSKKLSEEERVALKQKRAEVAEQGNERGELVSNDMYMTTHPMAGHGIYKTSPLGDRIELNDGSIWQVWFSSDWEVVRRWMYWNDQVIICPGTFFDAADYLLVSQRTGEVVPVNLVEIEVIVGDPYFMGQRLWIERVDYIFDMVCGCYFYEIRLNDGSYWEVDTRDTYIASLMCPGDIVFVGVDEHFGSPSYNILVHFNTLEYVHADCVAR